MMFSDESGMFQNSFNPDWSPPPSDTIKGILEERQGSYSALVEWIYKMTDIHRNDIESMLDGHKPLEKNVARVLADQLSSTDDFWMKRSSDYRAKQEAKRKFTNLSEYDEPTISNEKYCDLITIDFMIQMSQGIAPKDCKVRYSKEDLASLLAENKNIFHKL